MAAFNSDKMILIAITNPFTDLNYTVTCGMTSHTKLNGTVMAEYKKLVTNGRPTCFFQK